jgi:hypothetical protein
MDELRIFRITREKEIIGTILKILTEPGQFRVLMFRHTFYMSRVESLSVEPI